MSIHPALPKLENALTLISSGPVTRIVMLFREEFWRKGKLAKLGFIQSSDPMSPSPGRWRRSARR